MTTQFDAAFTQVVQEEGGYTNNKNDSGGATTWGITVATARANGYEGDMTSLTLDQAKAIYKSQYWDVLKLDAIALISEKIATKMFDASVNVGAGTAGKFLQRALNVLNLQATLFPNMTIDGLVGPMTVSNLKTFIAKRGADGETVILKAFNAQQGVRYIEIAEAAPKNETFEYGWLLNRI